MGSNPKDGERQVMDIDRAVLEAVAVMGPRAYGVPIHTIVETRLKRTVSYGALYVSIEFLEGRGLVRTERRDATPERGDRDKRYVFLTDDGRRELAKQSVNPCDWEPMFA